MADKKGFCMFCDWVHDLSYLDDKSFRQIIEAICAYTENNINPVESVNNNLKPIVSMMFHQIKRQEESSQKRAEAGKKGGVAKAKNSNVKTKRSKKKQNIAIDSKVKQSVSTITITDTDTETITDTETFTSSLSPSNEGESNAPAHAREEKKAYGEFSNVFLTEAEHSALTERFGGNTEKLLNTFSCKLKAKGYTYDNHYATLILWAEEDGVGKGNDKSYDIDDFFEAALKRRYEEFDEKYGGTGS